MGRKKKSQSPSHSSSSVKTRLQLRTMVLASNSRDSLSSTVASIVPDNPATVVPAMAATIQDGPAVESPRSVSKLVNDSDFISKEQFQEETMELESLPSKDKQIAVVEGTCPEFPDAKNQEVLESGNEITVSPEEGLDATRHGRSGTHLGSGFGFFGFSEI